MYIGDAKSDLKIKAIQKRCDSLKDRIDKFIDKYGSEKASKSSEFDRLANEHTKCMKLLNELQIEPPDKEEIPAISVKEIIEESRGIKTACEKLREFNKKYARTVIRVGSREFTERSRLQEECRKEKRSEPVTPPSLPVQKITTKIDPCKKLIDRYNSLTEGIKGATDNYSITTMINEQNGLLAELKRIGCERVPVFGPIIPPPRIPTREPARYALSPTYVYTRPLGNVSGPRGIAIRVNDWKIWSPTYRYTEL